MLSSNASNCSISRLNDRVELAWLGETCVAGWQTLGGRGGFRAVATSDGDSVPEMMARRCVVKMMISSTVPQSCSMSRRYKQLDLLETFPLIALLYEVVTSPRLLLGV